MAASRWASLLPLVILPFSLKILSSTYNFFLIEIGSQKQPPDLRASCFCNPSPKNQEKPFPCMIYFLTSLPCSKAHSGSHLSITSTLKPKASSHHSPPLSQTLRICPGSTGNSLCLIWKPPCLGVVKYFSFYVCTLSRLFFPRGSP